LAVLRPSLIVLRAGSDEGGQQCPGALG